MLPGDVEGDGPLQVFGQDRIREFGPEGILELEGGVMLGEPAHQAQGVHQAVVVFARKQHDLEALAALARIPAGGRGEGAGTEDGAFHDRQVHGKARPDEGRADVLIGTGRTDAGRHGRVVPQTAAAVQVGAEQARDVGSGRDRPRQQLPVGIRRPRRNDVDRESGADFRTVQVHEFPQGEAVPMRDLRDEHLPHDGRDRTLHHAAGGIDMVHDVQRRGVVSQELQHLHQPHHVLRIIEVTDTDVLDLHHDGVQALETFHVEVDMVRPRGQFGVAGREDGLQVAPEAEDVIHPAAPAGVPAVLRAETADPALLQGPVQLVLQGCRAEGEHGSLPDDLLGDGDHFVPERFRVLHGAGLGIDADDGLGVGLAEVHPLLLRLEDDLDAVDVVDILAGIDLLELAEDTVDEGRVAEQDLVLRDEILWIGLLQLADGHLLMGQVGQEQGHAHHGVATGVDGRIDDAAVAFAADEGSHLVHQGGHVHLTDCRSVVGAAMGLRHIAQRAGGRQVGHRGDRLPFLLGQAAEVVGDAHEGIFLHKGFPVLADQGEPVHIRVHAHAEVRLLADDGTAQVHEVHGKRLRVVGEIARRIAVEFDAFHAQALEQARHDDAAHGIDGVHHHGEMRVADGLHIHGRKGQDGVQVLVGEILFLDRAQVVDLREGELLGGGKVQDGLAFHRGEELALVVQELEGVPLARVVAGGQDDATVGLREEDGHLGGRRRGETAFDDIDAATHEGPDDELFHHVARQAGVLADDDLVAGTVRLRLALGQRRGIGCREFHDIDRSEGVARCATDGAADTGDGFNQGHKTFL